MANEGMGDTEIKFLCGELSLEGVLNIPEGPGPFPAVIVCHPHPLYGGSMDNNVVNALCESLTEAAFIPFKFNFRGVGRSQGSFNQGIGEQEDVSAAISFLTTVPEVDSGKIGLVGYSAGAVFAFPVAARDARIKALAGVSPPLSMLGESLKDCLKPKLIVSGSRDDFNTVSRIQEFCRHLPEPKECEIIEGADHFWWGYESRMAGKVAAFFTRVLKGR